MVYPKDFYDLIENFKLFPGVGDKSAERFVYCVDEMTEDEVKAFAENLKKFKKNIKKCDICGHYTSNNNICSICSDKSRDLTTICIVEDSKSVFKFEMSGTYKGLYHVLGGLISPIDGINPEDINISNLISKRLNENVKEVIIALTPSIEGETTSLYLQKLLENKNVKVSRLSYGLPIGSDIEYLDPITLTKAIDDRKFIS